MFISYILLNLCQVSLGFGLLLDLLPGLASYLHFLNQYLLFTLLLRRGYIWYHLNKSYFLSLNLYGSSHLVWWVGGTPINPCVIGTALHSIPAELLGECWQDPLKFIAIHNSHLSNWWTDWPPWPVPEQARVPLSAGSSRGMGQWEE